MNNLKRTFIFVLIVFGLLCGKSFAEDAMTSLDVAIKRSSTCDGVAVASKTSMGMGMVYTQRMKEGYKILCLETSVANQSGAIQKIDPSIFELMVGNDTESLMAIKRKGESHATFGHEAAKGDFIVTAKETVTFLLYFGISAEYGGMPIEELDMKLLINIPNKQKREVKIIRIDQIDIKTCP